jgi:hypothetical protein
MKKTKKMERTMAREVTQLMSMAVKAVRMRKMRRIQPLPKAVGLRLQPPDRRQVRQL